MPLLHWIRRRVQPPGFPPPIPDGALAVIGDVHGRADLLVPLVQALADRAPADARLVLVGDYVDRGEHSADVLALLPRLQRGWRGEVVCLRGNHEQMMLDFLDDPVDSGRFWLRNGGLATLASYRIAPGSQGDADLRTARDQLRARLPAGTEDWLRALPLSLRSGNVLVAHAGADPAAPPDAQDDTTLLWGHPAFEQTVRSDGVWVAHGHTIRPVASADAGRIGVDTGAYATGRLSAALIAEGSCRFFATGPGGVVPG